MAEDRVSTYLAAAQRAVEYVHSKMRFGSSNQFPDFWENYQRNEAAFRNVALTTYGVPDFLSPVVGPVAGLATFTLPFVCILKTDSAKAAAGLQPPDYTDHGSASTLHYIELEASTAEGFGCGNCGGQSALAFMKLYHEGIRPLDWMWLTNGRHAFVLIGKSDGRSVKPADWGPDAVVCDCLVHDAYHLPPDRGAEVLLARMAMNSDEAYSVYRSTDRAPAVWEVREGTRVEARTRDGTYYPGQILQAKGGKYAVLFDDGDSITVELSQLRLPNR